MLEKAEIFVSKKLGNKFYTHSKYPMHREEIAQWLVEFYEEQIK